MTLRAWSDVHILILEQNTRTCTKCPPNRTCPFTARSRSTLSPTLSSPASKFGVSNGLSPPMSARRIPRLVLFNVSGASPTLNLVASNSVTVRQQPLTEIESPMWQSPRIGALSPIVRLQPPPPLSVTSNVWMSTMTPRCSTYTWSVSVGDGTRIYAHDACKHSRGCGRV